MTPKGALAESRGGTIKVLGNRLIDPNEMVGYSSGAVRCRQRLGGLLKYYYRSRMVNLFSRAESVENI
jgi:hypothetical protein